METIILCVVFQVECNLYSKTACFLLFQISCTCAVHAQRACHISKLWWSTECVVQSEQGTDICVCVENTCVTTPKTSRHIAGFILPCSVLFCTLNNWSPCGSPDEATTVFHFLFYWRQNDIVQKSILSKQLSISVFVLIIDNHSVLTVNDRAVIIIDDRVGSHKLEMRNVVKRI